MKKIIITVLLSLVLCCCISSATINIIESNKSNTYIEWSWSSGLGITNLSIDGYKVILADYESTSFILSDLNANETHTIKLYNATSSGELTSRTLPSEGDIYLVILFSYIFFIVAVIVIVIGKWIPFLAWVGCGLTIIGLVNSISISFWSAFVFMCVFCAGVIVAMDSGED